jgi:hypothetical protein
MRIQDCNKKHAVLAVLTGKTDELAPNCLFKALENDNSLILATVMADCRGCGPPVQYGQNKL